MRRDLAGRAVLIAAGVGTALGAGAGLANAAPLEQDLQQDQSGQNAFDQAPASPTEGLTGSVPMAPELPLDTLPTKTQAASPLDVASADQLASASGLLGGLGSGGSTEQASPSTGGASDSTEAASPSSASPSSASPSTSGSESSSPRTSGAESTSPSSASPSTSSGSSDSSSSKATDADSASPSSTSSTGSSAAPSSGGVERGGTTYYGAG